MSTVSKTVWCTQEDRIRLTNEYWSEVEKSEGFDVEGIIKPPDSCALIPVNCESSFYRRTLVKRYALLGLHRYNILQETNFMLDAVQKYNFSAHFLSSYYITLVAREAGVQKIFQVRIDDKKLGILDLTVSIARPKDEVTIKKPLAVSDDCHLQSELPDWPSDDAFNDTNQFYMVKKSEWQASNWISLYLELTVVACNRFILLDHVPESIMAKLKILKVAIETSEDVDDKLKAKCVQVYITFKGLAETHPRVSVEIGEHVERRVIVRRVLNEETGYLSILGEFRSGYNAEQSSVALRRGEERLQSSKRPTGSGEKGQRSKKRSRSV